MLFTCSKLAEFVQECFGEINKFSNGISQSLGKRVPYKKKGKYIVVSCHGAGCKSCDSEWRKCCGEGAAEFSSAWSSNQPLPAGYNARSMFSLLTKELSVHKHRALWAELLSRLNSSSEFHGLAFFFFWDNLLCQDVAPTHRFSSVFFCGSQCFALSVTLVFQPACGVKVTIYAPCVFKHPCWT